MHEYFQGTVGERIQDLLREKKMTQAVLAQRTQISKATLNRYITDENSRIPHDALLQIARVLGVSTDFLLGATDIPYRTNYDIEELGLTAAAAAKLYTGELNPHIVSQLLENPYFAQMVSEIAAFMEGTESTATATYNGMMKVASKVMYLQGKKHLEDREAAKAALQDMKNHVILHVLKRSQGCASGHEESHDSFDAAGYDHDPCRFRKPACRPQEAGG